MKIKKLGRLLNLPKELSLEDKTSVERIQLNQERDQEDKKPLRIIDNLMT